MRFYQYFRLKTVLYHVIVKKKQKEKIKINIKK